MTTPSRKTEYDLTEKQEEHRLLRRELEANRQFVFERPLVIASAGLAGYAGLSGSMDLRLIPVLVLAVLLFNLWFTYNRQLSNARIISYIQLVHDPARLQPWVGWESALHGYRTWLAKHPHSWRQACKASTPQQDSMGYYASIFWFHISVGIVVCALVLSQRKGLPSLCVSDPNCTDIGFAVAVADGVALLLYLGAAFLIRPRRIRFAIELCRDIWEEVFRSEHIQRATDAPACADDQSAARPV